MVAQGAAFVVVMEQAAFLQEGHGLVDEGVGAVVVAVDGQGEAVAGPGLEPLLHVVGHVGGRTGDHGVVVDHPVREDVAQGPASRAT